MAKILKEVKIVDDSGKLLGYVQHIDDIGYKYFRGLIIDKKVISDNFSSYARAEMYVLNFRR